LWFLSIGFSPVLFGFPVDVPIRFCYPILLWFLPFGFPPLVFLFWFLPIRMLPPDSPLVSLLSYWFRRISLFDSSAPFWVYFSLLNSFLCLCFLVDFCGRLCCPILLCFLSFAFSPLVSLLVLSFHMDFPMRFCCLIIRWFLFFVISPCLCFFVDFPVNFCGPIILGLFSFAFSPLVFPCGFPRGVLLPDTILAFSFAFSLLVRFPRGLPR